MDDAFWDLIRDCVELEMHQFIRFPTFVCTLRGSHGTISAERIITFSDRMKRNSMRTQATQTDRGSRQSANISSPSGAQKHSHSQFPQKVSQVWPRASCCLLLQS